IGRGYRFARAVEREAKDLRTAPPIAAHITIPPHPAVMVGREIELGALLAALGRARAGERREVFVTGGPGSGKTALLDAFLERVAAPVLIARGQCFEQTASVEPFLPILGALNRLCRGPFRERLIEILYGNAPMWLLRLPGLLTDERAEALGRK